MSERAQDVISIIGIFLMLIVFGAGLYFLARIPSPYAGPKYDSCRACHGGKCTRGSIR